MPLAGGGGIGLSALDEVRVEVLELSCNLEDRKATPLAVAVPHLVTRASSWGRAQIWLAVLSDAVSLLGCTADTQY